MALTHARNGHALCDTKLNTGCAKPSLLKTWLWTRCSPLPPSSAPSLSFVCVMFLSTVLTGPFSSVSGRDGLGCFALRARAALGGALLGGVTLAQWLTVFPSFSSSMSASLLYWPLFSSVATGVRLVYRGSTARVILMVPIASSTHASNRSVDRCASLCGHSKVHASALCGSAAHVILVKCEPFSADLLQKTDSADSL